MNRSVVHMPRHPTDANRKYPLSDSSERVRQHESREDVDTQMQGKVCYKLQADEYGVLSICSFDWQITCECLETPGQDV